MPNRLLLFASVVTSGLVLSVSQSFGQDFGPYRYRTGVEQTHMRWEESIKIIGTTATMTFCTTMIMNYQERKSKCWTDKPILAKKQEFVLKWRDGHETYSLDLATKILVVSDGRPIAKVGPGKIPWSQTPIVE